jgi:type IV secretion system protein VirD4
MSQVHFILDEAALLGPMTGVDDALGIGRGYGVRLQLYYQSVGQLRRCFPEGAEQTVMSNTTQVFFGVNDNATADYVSARLGEKTIVVTGGGTGYSRTYNSGTGGEAHGTSESWSTNDSWSQQARRLLKPEEVAALSPRLAITFTPGVPPVLTKLIRYFEHRPEDWQALAVPVRRPRRGVGALLVQMLIALPLGLLASGTTVAALERMQENARPRHYEYEQPPAPARQSPTKPSSQTSPPKKGTSNERDRKQTLQRPSRDP